MKNLSTVEELCYQVRQQNSSGWCLQGRHTDCWGTYCHCNCHEEMAS